MCPNIRKWRSLEYYTVKDGINLDKLEIFSFCLLAGKEGFARFPSALLRADREN
jgi:hypothetical protein